MQILEENLKRYCRFSLFSYSGTADAEIAGIVAVDETNSQTGLIDILSDICKEIRKILFWHYHMLDQDSRQVVLSVLSELLYEGTLLLGIFTPVECPNSADGYITMTQKGRSGRMTYEKVKPLLKEVENKRFYEVPGRDQ